VVVWLDPAGESVGVGDGEGAEGWFPAVDEGAFDESGWSFTFVGLLAGFFGALAGSFVFDVADGEPEQLDDSVVVGKVPAVLDDLAELVVERLDRVRIRYEIRGRSGQRSPQGSRFVVVRFRGVLEEQLGQADLHAELRARVSTWPPLRPA
jgi:hypothetical protein